MIDSEGVTRGRGLGGEGVCVGSENNVWICRLIDVGGGLRIGRWGKNIPKPRSITVLCKDN